MVVPEQVLHSVLVLTWGAEDAASRQAAAMNALGLAQSDLDDAAAHVESHRGDGDWGGRADDVNSRARERVQHGIDNGMLPSDFSDLAAAPAEDAADEDDVFATLGVQSPAESVAAAGDALEAFIDDDGEEEPLVSDPVVAEEDEGDEDDDVFATLGVAGPAVALAAMDEDDPLAALMDDDDDEEEEEVEEVDETEEEEEAETEPPTVDAAKAYLMVLETVWVDGILDPGEVSLLARRRAELGLSFEDHLALVREMLG